MTPGPPTEYENLSPEQAACIDSRCDAFEEAWKAGRADRSFPRITDYLRDHEEPEQTVLLHELVALDRACRERYGVPVRPEEYEELGVAADTTQVADVPTALRSPGDVRQPASWPSLPGLKLLQIVGSGGMGVVYRARQAALERDVAVKLLRDAPLGDGGQRGRFAQEARTVARLHHPHLVQVFEFGEVPSACGTTTQPYLVLEFVSGGSLADLLRGVPRPPMEAARLVETLSGAVHYAHQQGVIHRDLKPANVMLSFGGEAQVTGPAGVACGSPLNMMPKITDFGLAKFQAGSDLTRTGDVLGTPSYMAPEQTSGKSDGITPAVDVYGLGAILYEMLTGRPPFIAETAVATVYLVQHEEPVPPRRLQPTVPRDLETICLKCLRKEVRERYATAQALADDLGRFLAGEPIRARPVNAAERMVRWCRRKPVIAGLLAALLLAIVFGGAGIVWQWNRAEERATEAQKAWERAEANYAKVRDSVDRMAEVADELSRRPRALLEGQAALRQALAAYQALLAEKGTDPVVRQRTAKTHLRIGEIYAWLGQRTEASEHYRLARELLERLHDVRPADRDIRRLLAQCFQQEGFFLSRGFYTPKVDEAELAFGRAVELRKKLCADEPDNADYTLELAESVLGLANLHIEPQRFAQGAGLRQRALTLLTPLYDASPKNTRFLHQLALCVSSIGNACRAAKESSEAEKHYRHALLLGQQWVELEPDNPVGRDVLAGSHLILGRLLWEMKRPEEAVGCFRECLQVREQLVKDFPRAVDYHVGLSFAYWRLTDFERSRKQFGDAEKAAQRGIGAAKQALAESPSAANAQWILSMNSSCLALAQQKLDRRRDAAQACRAAAEGFRKLAEDYPEEPNYHDNARTCQRRLALLLVETGDYRDAVEAFRVSIKLKPDDAMAHSQLAWLLATCPEARFRDPAEAVQLANKAVSINGKDGNHWHTLGVAHYRAGDNQAALSALEKSMLLGDGGNSLDWFFLAMIHHRLGDKDKARKWFDRAVEWMDKHKPEDGDLRRFRAEAEGMLGAGIRGWEAGLRQC